MASASVACCLEQRSTRRSFSSLHGSSCSAVSSPTILSRSSPRTAIALAYVSLRACMAEVKIRRSRRASVLTRSRGAVVARETTGRLRSVKLPVAMDDGSHR